MAVHFQLTREELEGALSPFGIGRIQDLRPLPEGSINTNHRLVSDRGVLFARLSAHTREELELEAALLDELRHEGLAVIPPLRTADGQPFVPWRDGALSLFTWAAGEHVPQSDVDDRHLWELGRVLGRLHQLGNSFGLRRENPFGPTTVRGWLDELTASGGRGQAEVAAALPLLQLGLDRAEELATADCAVIHADLFRDNVLWLGERISAVLDFEMACTAPAALDPAIAMLDWCWVDGDFAARRVHALGEGYRGAAQHEPFSAATLAAALCFSACRFTLSRLRDFHFSPLPPEALTRKDWREMRARLVRALALGEQGLRALWA